MKARKIAGLRLVNYLNDGITWKSHKDVILDFWITYRCKDYGYSPNQFDGMQRVVELPTEAQKRYEEWFNQFDFQNEGDPNWINFVNGTLNIFYHTSDPQEEPDGQWYIDMMQSEVEARDIVETQVYHGTPNVNAFWKVDTNSKTEEVGGRRNGYLYVNRLADIEPKNTKGYYWAVAFQCTEVVSLAYDDAGVKKRKYICWAANVSHMTLLQIGADGRFKIIPVFVEGKVWKSDRYIPEGNVTQAVLTPSALNNYLEKNFHQLYGVWDDIDEKVKSVREQSTARLTALNTMNDEEIKVSRVIPDVDEFIKSGNVSPERLEYNKQVRKAIIKKTHERDKEARATVRAIVKAEKRKARDNRAKFHVSDNF